MFAGGLNERRLSLLVLSKIGELHVSWSLDEERVVISLLSMGVVGFGQTVLSRDYVDVVPLHVYSV